MIIRLRLRQNARSACGQSAFVGEKQMIPVNHASGINFISPQCACCIAFAADVVAVFAAQNIVAHNSEFANALRVQV